MEYSRASENFRKVICYVQLYGPSLFLFHDCPVYRGLGDLLEISEFSDFIKLDSPPMSREVFGVPNTLSRAQRPFTLLWTLSLPPLLVYLQVIPNILFQLTVWCITITMIMLPFQQDLKRILDLGLNASVFQRPSTAFMRLKDGGHCICMPSSRPYSTRNC